MTKKIKSTYDTFYESLSKEEQKKFDEEYRELLVSELLLAAMQEDDVSVRNLAQAAGVSPTIVQGMRSGARKNVSMQSFFKILKALDYSLFVEKNGTKTPIDISYTTKQ